MAASQPQLCRRQFLRFFPRGFADARYLDWERQYKDDAHQRWVEELGPAALSRLLRRREWTEIVARAVRIESRTNLLFSFEKMGLRDAAKTRQGARLLAEGLHDLLYGRGSDEERFQRWCEAIEQLPHPGTRVFTWPVVTVFGFLADPARHIFLKPNVTRTAAARYGFPLEYKSRPGWDVYRSMLSFAELLRRDLRDLHPRDMIDLQSFMWVLGSEEYAGRTFKSALTTRYRSQSRETSV